MKICIINNRYGVFAKGGAEAIIKTTVTDFNHDNHETLIISTKPYFKYSIKSKEKGVVYIRSLYYFFEKLPKPFRIIWHLLDFINILSFLKLLKILISFKADLVITHNLKGLGLLTVVIPKILKIKHIHVLHDIQLLHPSGLLLHDKEEIVNSFFAKIYQYVNMLYFKKATYIISPSRWLLNIHTNLGFFKNSKKIVLANPLTFNSKINISTKRGKNIFIFLYVGQIETHKGIECLLKAYLEFKKLFKTKKTLLKIVGSGSKEKFYRQKYKENKTIEFLGKKNTSTVKQLMLSSNCLVISSLCYENAPTVYFEAVSCTLPVIASRLGGTVEFVHDLGGVLFKAGDSLDLMKKMIWVTKNPRILIDVQIKAKKRLQNKLKTKYSRILLNL